MSITVQPELVEALQPEATLTLRIVSGEPAGLLAAALSAAVAELAAPVTLAGGGGGPRSGDWAGPKFLTPALPVPGGVLALLDVGDTPGPVLQRLPGLLADRLRAAGVRQAVLGCPELIGQRYAGAWALGPAARAWWAGPAGTPPPAGTAPVPGCWRPALDWLAQVRGEDPLQAVVLSAELPVTTAELPVLAGALLTTGYPLAAVGGDFTGRTLAAVLSGGRRGAAPGVALTEAGGGPGAAVAAMLRLREAIRSRPAELVWAGVHAVPDAARLLFPRWQPVTGGSGPAAGPEAEYVVEELADRLVPDAHWYQVLSAGHLERLGAAPPGAVPLVGGRVELTLGEPEQWLPGHPDRDGLLALGRQLLAGCRADRDEVARLRRERRPPVG